MVPSAFDSSTPPSSPTQSLLIPTPSTSAGLSPSPQPFTSSPTARQRRTVLVTMGPCTVQGKNGWRCSCTCGSCTSDLGASSASCDNCMHPMFMHSDYGKSLAPSIISTSHLYLLTYGDADSCLIVATPTPQAFTLQAPPSPPRAQLSLDKRTCPRTHTVKRLAEILDEEWVVLVRGTPSSGKTTLATLLRDYFKARRDHVI